MKGFENKKKFKLFKKQKILNFIRKQNFRRYLYMDHRMISIQT